VSTKNLVELDLAAALDEEDWQQRITQAFGGEPLKFDVIIGNPPYQEMDGGAKASASPLYHRFIQLALQLDPRLMSFIIPARWYSGGKGLRDFRERMLKDKRIRELHDFFDATELFPDIDLSGGACYFLWDKEYSGDCEVTSYRNGKTNTMTRPLRWKQNATFIRFNEAISILEKIHEEEFISFADGVSSRKPFGLPTNVNVSKIPKDGDIRIFAYPENGYIARSEISRNWELVDKVKVLVSYVYGERGEFPYMVIAKPFIGEAGTCCSETYLIARVCDTFDEAKNIVSYMCTRFFRFLVLLNKNTQHATSQVYSLVPVQDFSEPWTDEKLYKKYRLTPEEIGFIESLVRPMNGA
jgi:site-specific DNA-methyltransferase (adenine-specific)